LIGPSQMVLFKIKVIYRGASIWPTYRLWKFNLVKKIWNKMWFNCEHFRAHTLGTWEDVGNIIGNIEGTSRSKKREPSTPFPKWKKKSVSSPPRHQKLNPKLNCICIYPSTLKKT
jgi:hypothetical protein